MPILASLLEALKPLCCLPSRFFYDKAVESGSVEGYPGYLLALAGLSFEALPSGPFP